MFTFSAPEHGCVNNGDPDDVRRHRANYVVTVKQRTNTVFLIDGTSLFVVEIQWWKQLSVDSGNTIGYKMSVSLVTRKCFIGLELLQRKPICFKFTCKCKDMQPFLGCSCSNCCRESSTCLMRFVYVEIAIRHFGPFTEPSTPSHTCWHIPANLTYGQWYPKYITYSVKSTKFCIFHYWGCVGPMFGGPLDLWLQELWSHYRV